MNRKTTYLIPAFAAIFALMFAFAPTLASADHGDSSNDEWTGQKNHKMHKVIEVDNFIGSILITEDENRQSLKDQVTVSLNEAASGLDVMGGHIGVAVNENGEKFLVWALKSIEKDVEANTATVRIYVIDAADVLNTTTVTKEIDLSGKNGKHAQNGDRLDNKIERLEEKFSESSGNADIDAARTTFLEKLQELRAALENGDSDRVSELRDELRDLRSELGNARQYQK